MYAIVEIAGQQFKVSKDLKVFVHRLPSEEGKSVSFNKVYLLDDNGTITIGAPAIEGASVEAKVLKHLKGDKVIIFKKKRRKGYKKKNGHRQSFTQILIESISVGGSKKGASEASPKKEVTEAETKVVADIAPKEEKPKIATKKEATEAPKKVAPKATSKEEAPKAKKVSATKTKKED